MDHRIVEALAEIDAFGAHAASTLESVCLERDRLRAERDAAVWSAALNRHACTWLVFVLLWVCVALAAAAGSPWAAATFVAAAFLWFMMRV